MGCFEDCCSTIMEPYGGNMPLFNSPTTNDATVTIVSESYDDGMKVTRIQTPPRTETKTLIQAIDNVLGMIGDLDIGTMDKKLNGGKDDKIQSDKKQEHCEDSPLHGEQEQEQDKQPDLQTKREQKKNSKHF